MRRAVFLDRDGVINRAIVRDGLPYPPANAAAMEVLPGVPEALAALKAHGFALLVVTNQPDVARGTTSRAVVDEMHRVLAETLPIDHFYACYHDSADGCACRKPHPGMLLDGARDFGIDLSRSYMVGDRWRDCDAGLAAGCQTVFIDYGYRERQPDNPNFRASSLADAARIILEEQLP
jgi:D-glycero-D-manno-heptose 1,7-bisphosphate phosphatase